MTLGLVSAFVFINFLSNCIAVIVFLGLGRERFLPFGQIHPLQPPAYRVHTSTASLSLLIPAGFLTTAVYRQSSPITKPPNGTVPFDSCDSCTPPNSSRKTIMNIYIYIYTTEPRLPSSPPPRRKKKNRGRVGRRKRHRLLAGLTNQATA